VPDQTTHLAEVYVERGAARGLAAQADRARAAVHGLATDYVDMLFLPDDETCFHLFSGGDSADVAEACRRAGIAYDRIVEVASPSDVRKEIS